MGTQIESVLSCEKLDEGRTRVAKVDRIAAERFAQAQLGVSVESGEAANPE